MKNKNQNNRRGKNFGPPRADKRSAGDTRQNAPLNYDNRHDIRDEPRPDNWNSQRAPVGVAKDKTLIQGRHARGQQQIERHELGTKQPAPARQRDVNRQSLAGVAERVERGESVGRVERAEHVERVEQVAQLYGVLPVLEALRAGSRPLERITIAEGAHEHRLREILALARRASVPVRRAPRSELLRIADGANHQGIVASIAAARYRPVEELLDELAARVGTDEPPLAVVLDGVEDPRNLGAIIRTAECAGVHAVFVPERRAAGLTDTVAKAAAGALEYVPIARAANLARLIEELKKRGIWTIGTTSDAGQDYTAWDWTTPCALLLGGEGEGLRRLVRERCDALVRIPLRGHIESLNVSVAAGAVLYEAVRQRTAKDAAAYKQRVEE